jgi:DNA-binding response OmpR family regulator
MKPLILVVDDHHASAESLKQYLELRNFAVEIASSSAEVKALLKVVADADGLGHDVLIVDYYMDRNVNGLDLIRWCRRHGVAKPIILLTGAPPYKMADVRELIDRENLGPVKILIKPVDPEQLVNEIDELLPGQLRYERGQQ